MLMSVRQWSSLLLHTLGLLLLCVGVGSVHWIRGSAAGVRITLGLWTACIDGQCVSMFEDNAKIMHALGAWMYTVQGMVCAGLAAVILAFFIIVVFHCCSRCQVYYSSFLWSSGCLFLAGLCVGYGLFLYVFHCHQELVHVTEPFHFGYSFLAALTATFLVVLTGAFYMWEYWELRKQRIKYMLIN